VAKTIFLLRHAKSSWDAADAPDFDRPLAPRGREAAAAMAAYMRDRGYRPARVLCSPALRSRETWGLMALKLDPQVPTRYLKGLYLAPPSRLLDYLRRLPDNVDSVLVVGHNPGLQELAVALAADGEPKRVERLSRKFPTAALAVVRIDVGHWREVGPATGTLAAFVRPKDLG
jgi:phosphohistidine phosphatase